MTKPTHERPSPVLFEIDDASIVTPATAPEVPDLERNLPDQGAAGILGQLATRRPSRLWRIFLAVGLALVTAVISLAAWDFAVSLIERNLWLGRVFLVGLGLFLLAGIGLALKEWIAFSRLRRVDKLRQQCETAHQSGTLCAATQASKEAVRFYRGRADLRWAVENFHAQSRDLLDGDALLAVLERQLMAPLDLAAAREVEAAARQVATVTAIVPLALADVVAALVANLRMVRRVAEIYGGRAGVFGAWRLLRTVLLHLVATGAVAIGDDLISSVAGGGLVSKLSRRFGEGIVNGALTARVGVAAMDVCRPMPFHVLAKPKVSGLVKNALTGLFSKS